MTDRTPRTTDTREATTRKRTWVRPSTLPNPTPVPGLKFRWVRISTLGRSDTPNVSSRFREGYVPVKAKSQPDMKVDSNSDGNIEIGGMLLCAIPTEIAEDRTAVQERQSYQQLEAADRNFLRESDPRMPVIKPEGGSGQTFG